MIHFSPDSDSINMIVPIFSQLTNQTEQSEV